MRITSRDVTEVAVHTSLSPGEFPKLIETDMGNGQPFVRTHLDADVAMYRQVMGCINLLIIND